jgi:hypothetical protein
MPKQGRRPRVVPLSVVDATSLCDRGDEMTERRRSRRAASLARFEVAIGAIGVIAAVPVSVFAATPPGGGPPAPVEGPLSQLLGIALLLACTAVVVAILIGIARVVAGLGAGDVGPSSDPDGVVAMPPRSSIGRPVPILVAVAAAVAGVVAGREIAYERSMAGLGGALGGIIPIFFLVLDAGGLGLVGLVAIAIRRGHVSRAIATLLAAAGLLVTGAFGGAATAARTGALYHEPVVLESSGTTTFTLDTVTVPFATQHGGRATCRSDPDGRTVVDVTALDLGELGRGTLRAFMGLPVAATEPATAEFFIDAGDLPDGATPPSWSGRVLVSGLRADHASGRLAFDGVPQHVDEKMPAPASIWPATISGELSWTCQPW